MEKVSRYEWSPEMFGLFESAVQRLGAAEATPGMIRNLMGISGDALPNTRIIKSKLQKYRMKLNVNFQPPEGSKRKRNDQLAESEQPAEGERKRDDFMYPFSPSAKPKLSALVLFSGGQDSATCLAWALKTFRHVETVGFDYGQRHAVELTQRDAVFEALRQECPTLAARLGADTLLDVPTIKQIGSTAMTEAVEIKTGKNGLPSTFVPARNLLFLTFAGALAYRRGLKHIVTGVCETDYSGYPDCQDDTIKALQVALNLGMDTRLVLHTPLMFIDKKGTWEMAMHLGGRALVELILEHSHSCYKGDRTSPRKPWGWGCDACPACGLRRKWWEEYAKACQYDHEGPSKPSASVVETVVETETAAQLVQNHSGPKTPKELQDLSSNHGCAYQDPP